ncbi:MAG: hypothetical protein ABR910_05155 [Acidobacteriaceae bacterium]|jgi:Rod binding domain-containing protein
MGAAGVGLGSLAAQTSVLDSSADRMMEGLKESKSAADGAKIDKGAKEFEAVLLGSWLQQAQESFASVPGADEDSEDVGRGSMMSLGVQTLATSMASGGGIGIGTMIAKAMHAAADKANGTVEAPSAPAHARVSEEKRGGVD